MCPVEAVVGELPVHPAEVVHDIAAGDDENAMLAQRRQLGAEFEVVVEALVGVDAQLHDRAGRVRKGVHKHRPGAVVDAPAVEVRADPGRVDDVAHLRRQLREPGRRVLHRPLRGGNTRATPRTTADSATARTAGGTTASPGSRWYPLRVRRPANDQVTVLPQVHDSAKYRPAPRSLRRHSPAPPGSSSDVAASSSAAATRGGMAAVTACARTVCP